MKCHSNNVFGHIGLGFLILIQITLIVCEIERNNQTIKITNLRVLHENIFENETGVITTIIITNNTLQEVPENLLRNQTNLQTFEFRSNIIQWSFRLPENIFTNLTNLLTVNVSRNRLQTLPENIFRNQTNLLKLDLSTNQFLTLSENCFKSLTNLQSLDLSHNTLIILPENIFTNLTNLVTLDLSQNDLKTLFPNIFMSQTNLRTLNLRFNQLTTLSEKLFENQTKLQELTIGSNSLTTLPENVFKNQIDLLTLDLRMNKITSLAENIFQNQTNLQTLVLAGNRFRTLPDNIFKSLSNLQILNLAFTKSTTLPENLFKNLTKLQQIDFAWNELIELPENIFENQTSLEVLNLKGNNLKTLPENIFKSLNNLTYLSVGRNNLTTLPEKVFEHQTELTELNLGYNRLTTLPENIFKNQTDLELLFLGNNLLTELPENILKSQSKLTRLSIEQNKLKTLSKTTIGDILKNSNLTELYSSANPWLCDCDFVEAIRPHEDRKEIINFECSDSERIIEKFKRPIIITVIKELLRSNDSNEKYIKQLCGSPLSNEAAKMCPSGCNCLLSSDEKSVFFNCSNNNLMYIPSEFDSIVHYLPTLKELELNIDNNNITDLPTSTMPGFELIKKISAKNNSIKSINVENLPQNLTRIDLSENKLESLSSSVIQHLRDMKMLKEMALGRNAWKCDCDFMKMVQEFSDIVDYERIVCADNKRVIDRIVAANGDICSIPYPSSWIVRTSNWIMQHVSFLKQIDSENHLS